MAGIRNVRNFWIELNVDGRKHKVATGPRGKDGEFTLDVFVRDADGVSARCLTVTGRLTVEGGRLVSVSQPGSRPYDKLIQSKVWR